MLDYTEFDPEIELNRICKAKNLDYKTIEVLINWLSHIKFFYKSSNDILEHFSLEEYIKYSFEKLKQTKDIKVLQLDDTLINSQSLLYKYIEKIPFNKDEYNPRFSKKENGFILDDNGDYYLRASGVCHGRETIELVDQKDLFQILQHELQHINQNYIYPSEFPFANDMLQMLNEGEGEYHYHLIELYPYYLPVEEKNKYYIYYLVYTLLMLVIPRDMRNSWNKIDNIYPNSSIFANIFKDITSSDENRNNFSQLFALATLIVALCNPDNTQTIFNNSIETCITHCSNKVEKWNQKISVELELNRKNSLQHVQYHIKAVSERLNILQNPDLLQEKYMETISNEKNFIASEPKEEQEEFLQNLQLFTLEKFESILKNEVKEGIESIQKYQNKIEQTPQAILGEEDYKQYQYYQFGMELSKKMQILLSQELAFAELFEQFLKNVESYLIESKDPRLDEKLAFIDKIRCSCLTPSKKI